MNISDLKHGLKRKENRRGLRKAVKTLSMDYGKGSELIEFTSLDGEDFLLAPSDCLLG